MLESRIPPREIHRRNIVMVVAYPGDETLFAGGYMLSNPDWKWHVVSIFEGSRADWPDRYFEALGRLGATGEIVGISDPSGEHTTLQA